MPRIVEPFLMELHQEAASTKRILERVPNDKLDWKPHPQSMSLGELALHVASTPGDVAAIVELDEIEAPEFRGRPTVSNTSELLPKLEESVAQAQKTLEDMDDTKAVSMWKATRNGKEVMTAPRIGMVRAIMFNHWYHHRGQLSVYLRLLGISLPATYGPSADEDPFAVRGQ